MKIVPTEFVATATAITPFRQEHISSAYLGWLRDPEINQFLVGVSELTGIDDIETFCGKMMESENDYFFAIVTHPERTHIGNVRLGPISWADKTTGFGIMLGDQRFQGRGHAAEALSLVERFCFETLDLKLLAFPVVHGHDKALHLYRRNGYHEHADWPERFRKGAVDLPLIRFSKTKADWKSHRQSETSS